MNIKLEDDKCLIEFTDQEIEIFKNKKTLIIERNKIVPIVKPILETCIKVFQHYQIDYTKEKDQ
jgi:hypothetical protein